MNSETAGDPSPPASMGFSILWMIVSAMADNKLISTK
jgi:hypothetical protein